MEAFWMNWRLIKHEKLNIKDILSGGNHEAKKDNKPNLLDGLC